MQLENFADKRNEMELHSRNPFTQITAETNEKRFLNAPPSRYACHLATFAANVYVTNYVYNWLPGSWWSRSILNKQQLCFALNDPAASCLKRGTGFQLFVFVNNMHICENTARKAALVKFTRKPMDCEQMALSVSAFGHIFTFEFHSKYHPRQKVHFPTKDARDWNASIGETIENNIPNDYRLSENNNYLHDYTDTCLWLRKSRKDNTRCRCLVNLRMPTLNISLNEPPMYHYTHMICVYVCVNVAQSFKRERQREIK